MAEKALKFDSVAIMCPEPIINFGLSWFMLRTQPKMKVYFLQMNASLRKMTLGFENNMHLFSDMTHKCESYGEKEIETEVTIIYVMG